MEKKMVFAIILFVLLLGYYGIVKGEEDSLKAFFIIIGIVVVLWGIGTLFKDNNGLDDEDYEKIRIYEENHKDDWKGYSDIDIFGVGGYNALTAIPVPRTFTMGFNLNF